VAQALAISPTRMELMKLRRRASLAKRGHELLREKMDALIIEFFEVLRRVREVRAKAFDQLSSAYKSLSMCMARMGTIETQQAANESKRELQIEASTRLVMGVLTPTLEVRKVERSALERGYSLYTTSPLLDEVARNFEVSLRLLIELAELEESARVIAGELERTKRRANALEYIIIPRLLDSIKFIVMRLDEMERENFSRMKRIKAMMERRG